MLDKIETDRETIRLDGIDICPPFSVDLKVVHAVKIAMTAKKPGAPFTPMADGMRLNGKRELFGIGPLMDNLRTS